MHVCQRVLICAESSCGGNAKDAAQPARELLCVRLCCACCACCGAPQVSALVLAQAAVRACVSRVEATQTQAALIDLLRGQVRLA